MSILGLYIHLHLHQHMDDHIDDEDDNEDRDEREDEDEEDRSDEGETMVDPTDRIGQSLSALRHLSDTLCRLRRDRHRLPSAECSRETKVSRPSPWRIASPNRQLMSSLQERPELRRNG